MTITFQWLAGYISVQDRINRSSLSLAEPRQIKKNYKLQQWCVTFLLFVTESEAGILIFAVKLNK
jgi:hypothetical protein